MIDDGDNDPRDGRQAGKESASAADDDDAPDPGDSDRNGNDDPVTRPASPGRRKNLADRSVR
jgi:hypothetical protein